MSQLVRAKNPVTGAYFTTSEAHAKRHGLTYTTDGVRDRHGRIAPPSKDKPRAAGQTPAGGGSNQTTTTTGTGGGKQKQEG